MNVVYEETLIEKVRKAVDAADCAGKTIKCIEMQPYEFQALKRELVPGVDFSFKDRNELTLFGVKVVCK